MEGILPAFQPAIINQASLSNGILSLPRIPRGYGKESQRIGACAGYSTNYEPEKHRQIEDFLVLINKGKRMSHRDLAELIDRFMSTYPQNRSMRRCLKRNRSVAMTFFANHFSELLNLCQVAIS